MKLVCEKQHADSQSEQTAEVPDKGCGNGTVNYVFRCMFTVTVIELQKYGDMASNQKFMSLICDNIFRTQNLLFFFFQEKILRVLKCCNFL